MSRSSHRFFRLVGAAPDAVTSSWCLYVWIAPLSAGVHWVKQIAVAMLLEFLVVHSGAFLGRNLGIPGQSAWRAAAFSAVIALVYLGFAAAFSAAFGTWWPLWMMAALVAMKLWTLLLDREPPEREAERQMALWGASVFFYVAGAFLTALIPVPQLGIDDAVRVAAELPGSGLWIEQPQRVVAFAALYFGMLAFVKYRYQPSAALQSPGRS